MTSIKVNLFKLVRRLESETASKWSERAIGAEIGRHQTSVNRMMRGDVQRIDLDTLAAFLTFFRSHGMEVTLCDLLVEAEDGGEEEAED